MPFDNDHEKMTRRQFAGAAVLAGAALAAEKTEAALPAAADAIPIVDSHIHLFDGTRILGADYMGSPAYQAASKTSLPSMYESQARPLGIVGAMVVESSEFVDDNLWYLQVCRGDPYMLGVSGTLDPGMWDFGQYVAHFHRDPLFRAIRYRYQPFFSNEKNKVVLKANQVANLKLLAQADLALDTPNPSIDLMQATVLLADAIPDLRIIADHLPSFDPGPDNQKIYEAQVKEMAQRPNLFVKLTEVYHPRLSDGVIVKDYEPLRARLEYLYDAFGEDRVIFGTDYPNSYGVATLAEEAGLMKRFFSTKSREAAEKFFWKNSARAYKWTKRAPGQPSLA